MEARCGVRGSSELIADRPAPHIGHRYHAVSAGVPGSAASLSRFSSSAGRGFLPACPVVALEECAEGRGGGDGPAAREAAAAVALLDLVDDDDDRQCARRRAAALLAAAAAAAARPQLISPS